MKPSPQSLLVLMLMLSLRSAHLMGKQSVLVRKIDSKDKVPVQVTIIGLKEGIKKSLISQKTFRNNEKMHFDWDKGNNLIQAVYKDDPRGLKPLEVTQESTPAGSEIRIDRAKGIQISEPVHLFSETIDVDLVVPNDSKTYILVSGTEALTDAIAASAASGAPSPSVVSYKSVLFPDSQGKGSSGAFKLFTRIPTKVHVKSTGAGLKNCSKTTTINPEAIKKAGPHPRLRIDVFCTATLESQ